MTRTSLIKIWVVAGLLALGFTIALIKAGIIQVSRGKELKKLAENQYARSQSYEAPRGNIYDRNGNLLATSIPLDSIYAEPQHIEDPIGTAEKLARVFPNTKAELEKRLSSDSAFIWIARRVNPETSKKVRALNLNGIGFLKEEKRYYPNHALLGQVLGVVSIDGQGLSGIEGAYNEYLKPRSWNTLTMTDARGRKLKPFIAPNIGTLKGDDIYLTIDSEIQYIAEQALLQQVKEHNAKGGWLIAMDPKTGDLLAVANVPLLNPNQPDATSPGTRRITAISSLNEPGSVFKMITFAAALDADVLNANDLIDCEGGKYKIGRFTIRDIKEKGVITATDVFKYSSNVGTLKIAHRIGKERFEQVIRKFGFGSLAGLNLIEEASGRVPKASTWDEARFANVSFGYGFMASSLQIVSATASVANHGVRVFPRIIRSIQKQNGLGYIPTEAKRRSVRAISAKAAKALTDIMVEVTEKGGTGHAAYIEGIKIAGKTGTAEKTDGNGHYDKKRNLSSFIGFAPADNPEVIAIVVIDEPKGVAYGGAVAAPVWRKVVETALIKKGALAKPLEDSANTQPRVESATPHET